MERNSFGKSRLLHHMAGGNCVRLTKCRRSSDNLFDFYTSLYRGSLANLTVQEQLAIAKQQFPKSKKLARWNLVISHGKRKQVNALCYRAASFGCEVLEVKLSEELVDQVFVGCPMLGNLTGPSKIVHGAFYVVQSWDEKAVKVKDTEIGQELTVKMDHMKHMRLGYSLTYASCQSRTLRETVRLWDTNHKFFTSRHLALGISRSVSKRLVDFA